MFSTFLMKKNIQKRPVYEDWLRDPLSIINNIYASDPVNFEQKVQEYFDNKLNNEKNYYSIPCLNEVPVHELTPNCLVRYRCMIQDSFDPIYYTSVQRFKHKKTGDCVNITLKYKETLDNMDDYELCDFNEMNSASSSDERGSLKNPNLLNQRVTFYCVSVPGENTWVKNSYKQHNSFDLSGNLNGSTSTNVHRPTKRGIDDSKNDEYITDQQELNDESSDCLAKKTKTEIEIQSTNSLVKEQNFNLNFPLPSNDGTNIACLIKTYENFDQFKINDSYEFIGIFSQDPSLAYTLDEHSDSVHFQNYSDQITKQNDQDKVADQFKLNINSEESSMETEESKDNHNKENINCESKTVVSSFPPSLVPRLHCIKSVPLLHNNPLLKFERENKKISETDDFIVNIHLNSDDTHKYWDKQLRNFLITFYNDSNCQIPNDSSLIDSSQIYLIKLRKEIIGFFTDMLLGDALASEYLLMHLLSIVFMRKDVTVLGKFTLNITNIPQNVASHKIDDKRNFASCFYNSLKQFLTMSHLFPLTIDTLNKSNLIPNKDYNKNKLITGMLQLPENFHLIIDETGLSTGELNQKGLMNFNSLKDIVHWQKMNYDFSYHQQEFQTNIRMLILSQTKSILPSDCFLKLNANIDRFDSDKYESFISDLFNNMSLSLLNNIRKYLSILSNIDYKLNQTMQKIVEEDIVHIRQDQVGSGLSASRKEKLNIEDFHLLLVVARLQSLSYGKSELGLNEWNKAKSLEFERLNNRV